MKPKYQLIQGIFKFKIQRGKLQVS